MNKRIEELAMLCYTECGDYHIGSIQHFDYNKFAKSIVNECIKLCNPEDSYQDEWFNAKVDNVKRIKEYFGVEE